MFVRYAPQCNGCLVTIVNRCWHGCLRCCIAWCCIAPKMGVQSLWTLLEPVGRRINIEALANKRLAVGVWVALATTPSVHQQRPATDASIWLIQFIKAMRDDKGDMLPNAHLLGFFRRICRCRVAHHTTAVGVVSHTSPLQAAVPQDPPRVCL